jgi:hypothetical protein
MQQQDVVINLGGGVGEEQEDVHVLVGQEDMHVLAEQEEMHVAGMAAHAVQEDEAALQAPAAAFLQVHQQAPAQQQQPATAAQQQQQAPGSPRSDTSSQEAMQA